MIAEAAIVCAARGCKKPVDLDNGLCCKEHWEREANRIVRALDNMQEKKK